MSKAIIMSDTHWGCRNDREDILQHTVEFHRDILFPYIDDNGINTILHGGDLLDRRKHVNIRTLQIMRESFLEPMMERGMTFHIVPGNHDVYFRNTNETNSLTELIRMRGYDKFFLHTEPTKVEIGGMGIGMVPWITKDNHQSVLGFLQTTDAMTILGHFEINGFAMTGSHLCENGLSPKVFNRFKRVLSGHFHAPQQKDNIIYIGSPVEMTFGDAGHRRGFIVLDPTSDTLSIVESPHGLFTALSWPSTVDPASCKGRHVRVRIDNSEQNVKIDTNELVEKFMRAGAQTVEIDDRTMTSAATPEIETTDTISVLLSTIDDDESIRNKAELKTLMNELYQSAKEIQS